MQEHQPKQQSAKRVSQSELPLGPIKPTGGVAVEFFGLVCVENMRADWLDAALGERGFERVWDERA
jgi:hypothetical protein